MLATHSGGPAADVVAVVDVDAVVGVVVLPALVVAVLAATVTVFVFVVPHATSASAARAAVVAARSLIRWCSVGACSAPSCASGSACEYPRAEG